MVKNKLLKSFLVFYHLIICVFANKVLFLQSVLKNIQKTI